MLNSWADLAKNESNLIPSNNLMYHHGGNNENDNSALLLGGVNGQLGQNSAAVAAVAKAMMMSNNVGGAGQLLCNPNGVMGLNAMNMNTSGNSSMNKSRNDDNMMDDCDDDDTMDNDDDDCGSVNNDAEGVWSPDIEQSFQEALALYPPCGRRKIILSEEGKMYGRNELIARYIKVRTGKTRSRKQVSSHIQVLAKRKTKDFHNHLKEGKDGKLLNGPFANPFSNLTSAQIISPTPLPLQPNTQHTNMNGSLPLQNNTNAQDAMQSSSSHHHQQQQQQQQQQLNNQNKLFYGNNNNLSNHHQQQQQQQLSHQLSQRNNSGQSQLVQNLGQIQNQMWSHGLDTKTNLLMLPNSTNPDDIIPSSSSSSSSTSESNSRHIGLGLNGNHVSLSPDSSPSQNNWPLFNTTSSSSSNLFGKSIIGMHQLRLIEFSGFLEQRRDPDIYQKHLFVHINSSDLCYGNPSSTPNSTSNGTDGMSGDEFECIGYKEFADKFPENDLVHWPLSPNGTSTTGNSSDCKLISPASYLIKFWVDLNYNIEDGLSQFYAVTNLFESPESMPISCSTKVCSFGSQVVEKVETEHPRYENCGRYVYRIENSPMCEYMITFINKLKQLPDKNLKNSVLENFSVLQIIKNHETQEQLLTLAYVFEVSTSEHGAQHVIYRLTNK